MDQLMTWPFNILWTLPALGLALFGLPWFIGSFIRVGCGDDRRRSEDGEFELPPPGPLTSRHIVPQAESSRHELSVRCHCGTSVPFDGVIVHRRLDPQSTSWAVVDLERRSPDDRDYSVGGAV